MPLTVVAVLALAALVIGIVTGAQAFFFAGVALGAAAGLLFLLGAVFRSPAKQKMTS